MNPSPQDTAIGEMLRMIDQGKRSLWALPLARSLEARSAGLALEWAVSFVEEQLPRFAGRSPTSTATREGWLITLRAFMAAKVGFDEAARLSREIWYY